MRAELIRSDWFPIGDLVAVVVHHFIKLRVFRRPDRGQKVRLKAFVIAKNTVKMFGESSESLVFLRWKLSEKKLVFMTEKRREMMRAPRINDNQPRKNGPGKNCFAGEK